MSDADNMDNIPPYLDTTTIHEVFVDGHQLIEKKLKTISVCNGIENILVLIHDRTIDDKSYKVTETFDERHVETEMTEDEVNQFEEDWTRMWYSFWHRRSSCPNTPHCSSEKC